MITRPVCEWETWRHQIYANGYRAAMKNDPFNPFAMDEWKMGFMLYLEQTVSAPIRNQIPASCSARNVTQTQPNT